MKAIITREAVADTIKKLNEAGQKPTLAAIHAALGGKGSLTTLIKLKAEIEQATSAPQDSAEGLTQFRTLWAAAVGEGRKSMESQVAEMRAGLEALTVENERLEAAAIADAARVGEMTAQRDKLVDELSQANAGALAARANGEQSATKLAAALVEIGEIRAEHFRLVTNHAAQISATKDTAHSLAVECATLKERVAGSERAEKHAAAMADRLVAQLEKASGEITRLESAALDRDRLASELETVKKQFAALSKAKTPKRESGTSK